jgi:flagella basal body P-ring formation protein FlgA
MKKIIFIILFTLQLFSNNEIQSYYEIDSTNIQLKDIIPTTTKNILLYTMTEGKHSKRVRSKELLSKLKEYGYTQFHAKHAYIKFQQKSPIDTSKIEKELLGYYQQSYSDITIHSIKVSPRSYVESLDSNYTIKIQTKNFLHSRGTLSIKSTKNKQLFFDYKINATLPVFITSKDIDRNQELSYLNTRKKSIILDKFRAKPIQKLKKGYYESRFRIQKNTLLTIRDVKPLSLVKRGNTINVILNSSNISISFTARALQNGEKGDIITVQKANGKKIRVKIYAKNRAEVL